MVYPRVRIVISVLVHLWRASSRETEFRAYENAAPQHQTSNDENETEQHTMFGFCLVYLQSPWYETLVLELEFSPESELEPEKSRLWSLATLLNLSPKEDTESTIVQSLVKEGA